MSPKRSTKEIHLIKLILTIRRHSLTYNALIRLIHYQGKIQEKVYSSFIKPLKDFHKIAKIFYKDHGNILKRILVQFLKLFLQDNLLKLMSYAFYLIL